MFSCVSLYVREQTYIFTHTHTHSGGDLGISDCNRMNLQAMCSWCWSPVPLARRATHTQSECMNVFAQPRKIYTHVCRESRGSYVPAAEDIYMHVCIDTYSFCLAVSPLMLSPYFLPLSRIKPILRSVSRIKPIIQSGGGTHAHAPAQMPPPQSLVSDMTCISSSLVWRRNTCTRTHTSTYKHTHLVVKQCIYQI